MHRNGTVGSSKRQRWRCRDCRTSQTQRYADALQAKMFAIFIQWITTSNSLATIGLIHGKTPRTLRRWFDKFWLVRVPEQADPFRKHDQLFLDGTYFPGGCLLIASTDKHIVAWHWCKRENKANYIRLCEKIPAPIVVVVDGHRGSLAAIKEVWPETKVQRCLIHIYNNTRTKLTRNPRTIQGKALLKLARNLLKITNVEQAEQWLKHLQEFRNLYGDYVNEKTYRRDTDPSAIPRHAKRNAKWWYTHYRLRQALTALERHAQRGHLFTFVDPDAVSQVQPDTVLQPTTNVVENKNSLLKQCIRGHRGWQKEQQRTAADWLLLTKMQHPDDPIEIARSQRWGAQHDLKNPMYAPNEDTAHHETGAPAFFDNHIDTEYNHSVGIRKGQMR